MQQSRIVIVGLGGIFPSSPDLKTFWRHIASGQALMREAPAGRWVIPPDQAWADEVRDDHVRSRRACFITDFVLDESGLNLPKALIRKLDPMYHLLLHAGRQAWRSAHTELLDRARVGVIIGNIALPTNSASRLSAGRLIPLLNAAAGLPATGDELAGVDPLNRYVAGLPAGLLAHALDLGGGAFTLDAACASSLYAVKYAVDELQAGRADAMLAGGLSRPDSLYTQMGFSALHALSPTGICRPFDAGGDGLVVGEGCGMVLLKREADALRDGDDILAVIAGVGLSNDIGGNLMLPDSEGQLRAMRQAYANAQWRPGVVQHIECHGTGTPRGDAVELTSMLELWRDEDAAPGACVIGSVKSNVGHLLTGAGSAGLAKTLLALQHEILPPTASFTTPGEKPALAGSPLRVLRESEPWTQPKDGQPRRAAVSAFGFGGINAHLLLEQWREPARQAVRGFQSEAKAKETATTPIAVVGLAARLGPCADLAAVRRQLFGNDPVAPTSPTNWWNEPAAKQARGWFMNEVVAPQGRFRIPPTELADLLPQQLALLLASADALDDAQLAAAPAEQRQRTGVFIGIGLDLNTTNFHLRWVQLQREHGPALGDAVCGPLTANRTMGALGGIVASRVARAFHIGGPSFTLSSEHTSGLHALSTAMGALRRGEIDIALTGAVDLAGDPRWALPPVTGDHDLLGEGAVTLVLKRLDDARRDGDRVYAVLENSATATGGEIAQTAHAESLQRVWREAKAQATPQLVVTQRVPASLAQRLAPRAICFNPATRVGETGCAGGMVALLTAILALHERLLPGSDDEASQYWLHDQADGPRQAVVLSHSVDGNHAAVRLREGDVSAHVQPVGPTAPALVMIAADATALREAEAQAKVAREVQVFAAGCYARWGDAEHAVTLLARDVEELPGLIAEAQALVQAGQASTGDRVFFSPTPLARTGEIAFVYPGSGSHFPGMGRELARQWPAALHQQAGENARHRSQFADGALWQRQPGRELSHRDLIFSHVWAGTLVHDVLRYFDVPAHAAIGYSLGETTAMFSFRAWRDRDAMWQRMHESTLFTTDLSGRCDAARKCWKLPEDEDVDWLAGVIPVPADHVREALVGRQRVYLLIVNTPGECVIGGQRQAVEQLARDLHATLHPLTGVTTVHCEVARSAAQAYRELHLFDTHAPAGVRFYSGIRGQAYELTRDSIADSIVGQAVAPFDFSQVVRSAYADGVRLFVEVGPGATCTRMIGRILGNQPHAALAACPAGGDAVSSVVRVLARLIAEGVAVDLAPLFAEVSEKQAVKAAARVAVRRDRFVVKGGVKREAEAQALPAVIGVGPGLPGQPGVDAPSHVRASPDLQQSAAVAAALPADPLIQRMLATQAAQQEAQQRFLRVSQTWTQQLTSALGFQMRLLGQVGGGAATIDAPALPTPGAPLFDRQMCLEFAIGSIAKMLGPRFASVDAHPTRVRLPDEPLMLVDRIMELEGEPGSLGSGRVVTEHDIHPGAWYLDHGRIPTCIAVEAGQADLFLSGYLGIDFHTRGLAVYRLLDAKVTFHQALPTAGQVIHYDIHIDHFFRQDQTVLFRFWFDATVNGELLLTMREGCAGFFTDEELAAGRGIVLTSMDKRPQVGKLAGGYEPLVDVAVESYDDQQVSALRQGDLAGCFGARFAGLPVEQPSGLPGGRMTLVHRVLKLDPAGGRFGIGQITGEADIHPDDWFLTCHFVDDRVMPGTLMYECCLHTLRIFLLRLGFVGEASQLAYDPIPGVTGVLKCRGQVTQSTRKVQYELTLKELGYDEAGTPYAIADALMYADGRAVVQMLNLSVKLTGVTRGELETLWKRRREAGGAPGVVVSQGVSKRPALFDFDRIYAFAAGNPSEAFGERYRVFDDERKIARLPRPPFQFLDRIVAIAGCEPWVMRAGGVIEAQYDVPTDAWYFAADRQQRMPFAVLLETALQPCGWLAAYVGSALCSDEDLRFRNLGGKATQHRPVTPQSGTLTTQIEMTGASQSGGMIIQHYRMAMHDAHGLVYDGTTYFGFFSASALANQVGIRGAAPYQPAAQERQHAQTFDYPDHAPLPTARWRMIDRVTGYSATGGPHQLGWIEGQMRVRPEAWFFQAHFYQDPVVPGSLGLESFLQLLKIAAIRRWEAAPDQQFEVMPLGLTHSWTYRGQVIPADDLVTVRAVLTHVDDARREVRGDGFLEVDGRIIYQMVDFGLRMLP